MLAPMPALSPPPPPRLDRVGTPPRAAQLDPIPALPLSEAPVELLSARGLRRRHSFNGDASPSPLTVSLPPLPSTPALESAAPPPPREETSTLVAPDLDPSGSSSHDARGTSNPSPPTRTGRTKFFNGQKGYGFILDHNATDLNDEEVFVHYTAILSVQSGTGAFKSLSEGEEVEYSIAPGAKGWQAQNVTGPNGAPCIGTPLGSSSAYKSYPKPTSTALENSGSRSPRKLRPSTQEAAFPLYPQPYPIPGMYYGYWPPYGDPGVRSPMDGPGEWSYGAAGNGYWNPGATFGSPFDSDISLSPYTGPPSREHSFSHPHLYGYTPPSVPLPLSDDSMRYFGPSSFVEGAPLVQGSSSQGPSATPPGGALAVLEGDGGGYAGEGSYFPRQPWHGGQPGFFQQSFSTSIQSPSASHPFNTGPPFNVTESMLLGYPQAYPQYESGYDGSNLGVLDEQDTVSDQPPR